MRVSCIARFGSVWVSSSVTGGAWSWPSVACGTVLATGVYPNLLRRRCAGLGGADGAIVPDVTSANANAPTIPIGEKAVNLIAAR